MGGQRDPGLSCVLQIHRLEVSRAGCDQGREAEASESFWGKEGFSGRFQEGFIEEAAVDEGRMRMGRSLPGRTVGRGPSRQREQLK